MITGIEFKETELKAIAIEDGDWRRHISPKYSCQLEAVFLYNPDIKHQVDA